MLCDTHCHLNFDNFDMDREEVLTRAKAAGVIRILNPGVDEATSHQAVEYTQRFPEVFAAAGIHPNSAQSWSDHSLVMLQELAGREKVVAIGEIGLDYYRNLASKLLQQQIFSYQLALAADMDLPVIIHIRDSSEDDRSASQDALEILGAWHHELELRKSTLVNRAGVLHSFSSSFEVAEHAIKIGFMIGITGPVTFQNGVRLRKVVAELPVEHLLIETDSPFLTPVPYRGRRNEPARVLHVAEKIGELHNMDLDQIAEITTQNSERLFRW